MSIEIKQGQLFRSSDKEFVYNIFMYSPESPTMVVDILNNEFGSITTKNEYSVEEFRKQIEYGTIVEFCDLDDKVDNEQTE